MDILGLIQGLLGAKKPQQQQQRQSPSQRGFPGHIPSQRAVGGGSGANRGRMPNQVQAEDGSMVNPSFYQQRPQDVGQYGGGRAVAGGSGANRGRMPNQIQAEDGTFVNPSFYGHRQSSVQDMLDEVNQW